jgi:multiple sugar transport system substrate-binding protein
VVDQKLLRPLPEDRFPQKTLEASFNYMKATYSGADNKAYWIPTGLLTFGLVLNNKLWAKAGLTEKDVPTTWDKVIDLGKQLTERDAAGRITVAGYNPTGYVQAQWRTLHYQLGYWFFNQQHTRHLFDTPQMRRVLQFYDDLYKVHKVSATDFLPWDQSFGNNQAAMIYMSMNVLPNIRKFEGLEFTVHRTPTWNGTLAPAATHGFLDPQSLVVPVSTPDDRAAVAFDLLHFLYANKDFQIETALSQASFPLFKPALEDPRVKNDPVLKALEAQQDRVVQTIGLPQSVSDIGTKYAYEAPFVAGMAIPEALKQGQTEMDEAMKLGGPAYVREREYAHAAEMKFPG